MDTIRNTPANELASLNLNFDDSRLAKMLFRYRARNYPDTLSNEEQQRWDAYRQQKFNDPSTSHRTINQLRAEIENIQNAPDTIGSELVILEDLLQWIDKHQV